MRILVVSGHKLIGQSLVSMLTHLSWDAPTEVQLCDPHQALDRTRQTQPTLVLVDATVEFARAMNTVRTIAQALPEPSIVVLGSEDDDEAIVEAVMAGACGYVSRETSPDVLLTTMRSVQRGELGLTRKAALRVVRQMRRTVETRKVRTIPASIGNLTQREREIFELVRQGLRSREIAERLCIAEATVYKHTQNILDKLHVHSRTQAIFLADVDQAVPAHSQLNGVRAVK